jgi:hypothetical protein
MLPDVSHVSRGCFRKKGYKSIKNTSVVIYSYHRAHFLMLVGKFTIRISQN